MWWRAFWMTFMKCLWFTSLRTNLRIWWILKLRGILVASRKCQLAETLASKLIIQDPCWTSFQISHRCITTVEKSTSTTKRFWSFWKKFTKKVLWPTLTIYWLTEMKLKSHTTQMVWATKSSYQLTRIGISSKMLMISLSHKACNPNSCMFQKISLHFNILLIQFPKMNSFESCNVCLSSIMSIPSNKLRLRECWQLSMRFMFRFKLVIITFLIKCSQEMIFFLKKTMKLKWKLARKYFFIGRKINLFSFFLEKRFRLPSSKLEWSCSIRSWQNSASWKFPKSSSHSFEKIQYQYFNWRTFEIY